MHTLGTVNRTRLALILAAILIPGGFIALVGGWILQRASQTERGRRMIELARVQGAVLRTRVPAWLASPVLVDRQRAA